MNLKVRQKEYANSRVTALRVLVGMLIGLVLAFFLPSEFVAAINGYLPLHTALETAAIIAATMVFVIGWHTISIRPDYRLLVMACCFLGVAMLDFSHMMSFDGMPQFVTPASPEKTVNFWLAARLLALAGMLAYVVLPATVPGTSARWFMLAGVLLTVLLFHIWFLLFPQTVPTLFDANTGLTWLKVGMELAMALVYGLLAIVLWQRSQRDHKTDVLELSLASGIMAASEVFFAIYISMDDVYALVGHLYKIVAYGLLYRGIVVAGIRQPYHEIEMLGQRINAMLDALPDMLFELSPDGVIHHYHSRIHKRDLLAPPDEFLGKSVAEFLPENAMLTIRQAFADIEASGLTTGRQYYLGDGNHRVWFDISGSSRTTLEGDTRYVLVVRDVTDRERADHELRIAATAFSTQEGIMITDANTHILRVNAAFERTTGYSQEEVIGKKPSFFSSGRHDEVFYKQMWSSIAQSGFWRGEIWNRRKNGEIYPQALTITAVRNAQGDICNFVGDFIDISDLKAAEQKISRLSYFDALTGLPNRDRLMQIVAEAIETGIENKTWGALLFVDLDNFKIVNETIGYSAGDKLLVMVADRLSLLAGRRSSVARYGGDEYVVVLTGLDAPASNAADAASQKAQSVLATLEDNYDIDGVRYYTTGCVGVALVPPQPESPDQLLKQAGIALTQAKSSGRNRVMFFDPSLQDSISERAQLLSDMREAIRLRQFELYVQAQQSADGKTIGAEALIRWNHPTRGLLPPGVFIPLAESSDMMLVLGKEILELGLEILQRWQQIPDCQSIKLSVNLSASQFYEADFCTRLEQSLVSHNVDASLLMLEFTESTLMGNMVQARQIMQQASAAGVRFSIDDFGTGYSSLAYLSQLPLHQLKIDQSFVHSMITSDKDRQIVKTIIEMAASLGLEVIAEGVETQEQRDQLETLGCTLYQGYLAGRPVRVEEFEQWLQQQR